MTAKPPTEATLHEGRSEETVASHWLQNLKPHVKPQVKPPLKPGFKALSDCPYCGERKPLKVSKNIQWQVQNDSILTKEIEKKKMMGTLEQKSQQHWMPMECDPGAAYKPPLPVHPTQQLSSNTS